MVFDIFKESPTSGKCRFDRGLWEGLKAIWAMPKIDRALSKQKKGFIRHERHTETFVLSECLKRNISALRENNSESDQGWKKSYK